MRLIDADARMQWLEDNTTEEEWMVNQYNADWVYSMLETSPTIDAVHVIRCKECKQWTGIALGSRCKHFSFAPLAYCYTNPDDFCSRGERKEGDSNDKA